MRWRRRRRRAEGIAALMHSTSLYLLDNNGAVIIGIALDDLALVIKYGNNGGMAEELPGGWRLEFTGPKGKE